MALLIFIELHELWPFAVQQNFVIKRSDITKPSYNRVILLVPAVLYFFMFLYPRIHVVYKGGI